ncbi:TRAP transporter small permease subunit [Gallibacterium trehalosifermentans]|uniref:TRAP transporter small permease protein n=1 Tax=Gallibacterium trehalosifermentans TaxID=516935 RepID=A0ABV6GZW3_9PAST
MNQVNYFIKKLLEIGAAVMLAVMSCLVFLNVVLRYGFNTSFTMTEELSRFLFIWVIFLGAILAFMENAHVNVAVLADKLSLKGQQILTLVTNSIMLVCCYLIFVGSYQQMVINWHNYSPISEIPTGISFLASVIMSGFIAILISLRIIITAALLVKGEKV